MNAALVSDGAITNLQSCASLIVDPAAITANGGVTYREKAAVQNPCAASTSAALANERGPFDS